MIEKLTKEQEDTFPYFVEKWTKIGQSTGPCDVEAVKPLIEKIHKDAKLVIPKYFFHYKNPSDMVKAIAMVKILEDFDIKKDYGNETFSGSYEDWTNAFNLTYKQYSEQYKGLDWSTKNLKENMASFLMKVL
jgi:hypothetical protein